MVEKEIQVVYEINGHIVIQDLNFTTFYFLKLRNENLGTLTNKWLIQSGTV